MVMNKKLKQKWITALKSGVYKQTTGKLKDNTGYCCLGVLCEVAGYKAELNSSYWGFALPTYDVDLDDCQSFEVGALTDKLADEFGIASYTDYLMGLNDGDAANNVKSAPFKQIADWIEATIAEE
jgi:hypothetical protein